LSLLLVVLAPTELLNGVPFWEAPLKAIGQSLLAGTAFLTLVLILELIPDRSHSTRVVLRLFAAAACYGATALLLRHALRTLAYSQRAFVVAAALGIVLAVFPYFLLSSRKVLGLAVLAVGLGSIFFLGTRSKLGGAKRDLLSTALKLVSFRAYPNLLEPVTMTRGGAIVPYGNAFLLVTGDGKFYILEWGSGNDTLRAQRVPLSPPREQSVENEDRKRLNELKMDAHRVTGMVMDTKSVPPRVFVAHQEWVPANECFTMRVSVASLPATTSTESGPTNSWKDIFETRPCVPVFPNFQYLESGGRLAWLGDKLLLTVGDFGLAESAHPPFTAAENASYGKVLLLGQAGEHEVFTVGHRNPQGILVDKQQHIWLTEHGPQGGDEINLLEKGRNYGYPTVTYGTAYGSYFWPLAPEAHDHGAFTEPVHAFVPSIGISNLIRIDSHRFSEWKGDLLVASLIRKSLMRVRLRDERVIYVEPILVGFRIRDLAEGADGRILLWTQEGVVVSLTTGPSKPVGRVIFTRCMACHEATGDSEPLAPSLRGIVGAGVARESAFPYSPAVRQLGGKWTEERLNAFLKDPNSYAPGSAMEPGQISDADERSALIEFLKNYK